MTIEQQHSKHSPTTESLRVPNHVKNFLKVFTLGAVFIGGATGIIMARSDEKAADELTAKRIAPTERCLEYVRELPKSPLPIFVKMPEDVESDCMVATADYDIDLLDLLNYERLGGLGKYALNDISGTLLLPPTEVELEDNLDELQAEVADISNVTLGIRGVLGASLGAVVGIMAWGGVDRLYVRPHSEE